MTSSTDTAKIIVIGNEKGGSGKSTLAIHMAIGLMDLGYTVGTLDLDSRQGTLTRFFQNRWKTMKDNEYELSCPMHIPIEKSDHDSIKARQEQERDHLKQALDILKNAHCEYIIIDTAGTDNTLTWLGHENADILLSPLNDSFIDLDLLAKIDGESHKVLRPSVYSDKVWSYRQKRAQSGKSRALDWYVIRNRINHINTNNKKDVQNILSDLQGRFAFTTIPGMGERVVFRELFLKGITLMDLHKIPKMPMSVSHISGRQEIRNILHTLNIRKKKKETKKTQSVNQTTIANQQDNAVNQKIA